MIGADWRTLTWWEYQARLTEWNREQGDEKPAPDLDRLALFMEAHGGRC